MIRVATALLSLLLSAISCASVPVSSVTLVINPDGTHQSAYPNDSAPTGLLAFSGLRGGVQNAGSESILVGTPYSHEICQYLTGTEKATATLSIVGVTGDDPATEGWTLSASNCATTSNLAHSALQTGSGTALVRAVGASSSDDSSAFSWIAFTPDPGDSGFDFPCAPTCSETTSGATLTVVTTFENAGLYWSETSGSTTNEAIVRYRAVGTAEWFQAMSLWWDNRTQGTAGGQVPRGFQQYRGSIFKLTPATTYEVEVMTQTASRKLAATQFTTADDTPPEAAPTQYGATSGALTLSVSGTASAWAVHEPSGASTTIDLNNGAGTPITISGSYIIVRGFILREFRNSGIAILDTASNIIIEDTEITAYGKVASDGLACNDAYGILIGENGQTNLNVKNITIRRNRIHHPNYDSNAWTETARTADSSCGVTAVTHPQGATPIQAVDTGGQIVYYSNTIDSSDTLRFKDCLSGSQNFSHNGDMRANSDVYRNDVGWCWDDTIQTEGSGENVRVYENYTHHGYVSIATAPVSVGPLYVMRNVSTRGQRTPGATTCEGNWWKMRVKPNSAASPSDVTIGGGAVYLLHNTLYNSSTAECVNQALSLDNDIAENVNVTSRCNILHSKSAPGSARFPMSNSDWNYDLYPFTIWDQEQANGILGVPTYDATHASGPYTQATGSLAYDSCGATLPNVNSGFLNAAPDIGAVERGQTAIVYGQP